jgi:hypothetical protein
MIFGGKGEAKGAAPEPAPGQGQKAADDAARDAEQHAIGDAFEDALAQTASAFDGTKQPWVVLKVFVEKGSPGKLLPALDGDGKLGKAYRSWTKWRYRGGLSRDRDDAGQKSDSLLVVPNPIADGSVQTIPCDAFMLDLGGSVADAEKARIAAIKQAFRRATLTLAQFRCAAECGDLAAHLSISRPTAETTGSGTDQHTVGTATYYLEAFCKEEKKEKKT